MGLGTAVCIGKICSSAASIYKIATGDHPLEKVGEVFDALGKGNDAVKQLNSPERDVLAHGLKHARKVLEKAYEDSLKNGHSPGFKEDVEAAFANLGEVFESCLPKGQALAKLNLDAEKIGEAIADAATAKALDIFKGGEGRKILVGLIVLAFAELDKYPKFMEALQRFNWKEVFERLESIKQDTTQLLAFAEEERQKRGIAEGFIHEMAGRVAASSGLDLGGKMQAVRTAIELYVAEIAGGAVQTNLGDIVDRALANAKRLADEGRSGLARAGLRKAAESLQREEEDRRAHYVESIQVLYGKARDIALAVFDSEAAAEAVLAMAKALYLNDAEGEREAIEAEATELESYGDEKGSNVHLVAAIALYKQLMAVEDLPERARLQNNLGNVLYWLGERESGTARLEAAVVAYRAALEEFTQDRVPLDWAGTQNNLGNVLLTLGQRESGTARFEEAVEAYRAALEERTRERVPLKWAMTQNNLGIALLRLGERESGTARLEEAVVAYLAALEERTQDRVPLGWAMTQNNLGNALAALGERECGTARLEEAVEAYRAALEELTRERVPLYWGTVQNNLGTALSTLGERESGTARLEAAVVAYRAALEEHTRERVPLNWAATQNNLGTALSTLGERESGTARLEEAVYAFREALKEWTLEAAPHWHDIAQDNLSVCLAVLDQRRKEQG